MGEKEDEKCFGREESEKRMRIRRRWRSQENVDSCSGNITGNTREWMNGMPIAFQTSPPPPLQLPTTPHVLVVCSNALITVPIISSVLDHKTSVVGHLEAAHSPHQFSPTVVHNHKVSVKINDCYVAMKYQRILYQKKDSRYHFTDLQLRELQSGYSCRNSEAASFRVY